MPSHPSTDPRAHGAAILARLAKLSAPAPLKPLVKGFAAEHAAYDKAHAHAEETKTARDAALAAVSAADDALDAGLGDVADKLVGAGLAKRSRPFAGLSPYSPTRMAELGYASEVKAYRSFASAVRKNGKLPKGVASALAACDTAARNVASSLARYEPLAADYVRAIGARDARLPSWTKALARLRRSAAAVWFDEPATYRAVFAAPDRVVAPVRRGKAKRRAAKPAA